MSIIKSHKIILFLLLISIIFRIGLIVATKPFSGWIDLLIYKSGGALISNGINPYNYTDNISLRETLRSTYIPDIDQHGFNYWVASNLPLSLLLYGLIDIIFNKLIIYRLIFSLFDCLIFWFLIQFVKKIWKKPLNNKKIILFSGITIFSPILFLWGTLLSEDKVIQTFIMILAVYFSASKSKISKTIISSFFLGTSIAFKMMGIYIIPLCLYYYLGRPNKLMDREILVRSVLYLSLLILFTTIWFFPFINSLTDIYDMIVVRLIRENVMPINASPWRLIQMIFPNVWQIIQVITASFFLTINLVGIVLRRIKLELIVASIIVFFTIFLNRYGSLDRMNIAMMVTIIIMGIKYYRSAVYLSLYYIIFGYILAGYDFLNLFVTKSLSINFQMYDSYFVLGFMVLFIYLLFKEVMKNIIPFTSLKNVTSPLKT